MIELRIPASILMRRTYIWSAAIVIPVFFLLKLLQGMLESPTHLTGKEMFHWVVWGRLPTVSFLFLLVGFATIFLLGGGFQHFTRTFRITIIVLQNSFIISFVLLLAFEWAAYLQAVYRDGGTFFYAIGPDHTPTIIPMVCMIQTVEGLLNLIGLFVLSFWAILGHWMVTKLRILTESDRGTDAAKCACTIVRGCVWATILLLALTTYGGIAAVLHSSIPSLINLGAGIANPLFAIATAVIMWSVFLWLVVRAWRQCRVVLRLSFVPPFVFQLPAERSADNRGN